MGCRWRRCAFSEVPRFDVHSRRNGEGYVVDCQAEILGHLNSRFVVPLLPLGVAPRPAGRLNPVFDIDGHPHSLVTQFAGAIDLRELGPVLLSLAAHDSEILNALDMLLTGI